jgi:hypothetical protein
VSFAKDGTVSKVVSQLPDTHKGQEQGALERFAAFLRLEPFAHHVEVVGELPEAGHDFLIRLDGQEIEVQITELKEQYEALPDLVIKKTKHYGSSIKPTWLLVFATFPYEMEYWHKGAKKTSERLRRTRAALGQLAHNPFQRIWFTDMQTTPIRIWPQDAQQGAPVGRDSLREARR